jgi:hypothetical protein
MLLDQAMRRQGRRRGTEQLEADITRGPGGRSGRPLSAALGPSYVGVSPVKWGLTCGDAVKPDRRCSQKTTGGLTWW